jgi:hypothetical protein
MNNCLGGKNCVLHNIGEEVLSKGIGKKRLKKIMDNSQALG